MNTNVFSCTRYHRTSSNCPRVSGLSISSTKYRQHSAEHLSHKQPLSLAATPHPPPPDPDKVSPAARQVRNPGRRANPPEPKPARTAHTPLRLLATGY